MQGNDVYGSITPGKVLPLINYSIVMEQHDRKVIEWKLNEETNC